MTINKYQEAALETDRHKDKLDEKMRVSPLGLVGEVGSLAAVYKKYLRDGDAYQAFEDHFREELGDVLWYLASLAYSFKIDLAGIQIAQPKSTSTFPLESLVALESTAASLFAARLGKTEGVDLSMAIKDSFEDVSRLAAFVDTPMDKLMSENLDKVRRRWGTPEDRQLKKSAHQFDAGFPDEEQLPRKVSVSFVERKKSGKPPTVIMKINGLNIGDRINDNSGEPDGYRFHDAFHWAYVAVLGWSPVIRALLKAKRKSDSAIDDAQDGARAIIAEECISLQVFSYAEGNGYFANLERVDHDLLKLIKNLTRDLEVKNLAEWEWELAIIVGYRAFESLKRNGGGTLHIDADQRTITYSKN